MDTLIKRKTEKVSIDRVKPAFMVQDANSSQNTSQQDRQTNKYKISEKIGYFLRRKGFYVTFKS